MPHPVDTRIGLAVNYPIPQLGASPGELRTAARSLHGAHRPAGPKCFARGRDADVRVARWARSASRSRAAHRTGPRRATGTGFATWCAGSDAAPPSCRMDAARRGRRGVLR